MVIMMADGRSSDGSAAIPLIDLNAVDAASRLLQAATSFGFVYIRHHDLNFSTEDVASIFSIVREEPS